MPAGATYIPLATTTLGSATASYTFSSIPSTYTDLRLIVVPGNDAGGNRALYHQINGDTGTNYSQTNMVGDGSTAVSNRTSSANQLNAASCSPTVGSVVAKLDFQEYANTNVFKTILMRGDTASVQTMGMVGLWRSTSAITSISTYLSGGNLATGTTLTLYGIKAA
jgi:hypothetical protein